MKHRHENPVAEEIEISEEDNNATVKYNKRKKRIIAIILIVILIIIACDLRLKIVRYTFTSDKVENSFKIALITDLHGNKYGNNQRTLIDAIDKENPDVVLLGGDIFDDQIDYERSEETRAGCYRNRLIALK